MYDTKVIRKKKKLVNYINVLHVFSKNLGGALFKFMSTFFFLYQKYKRAFEKSN